MLQLIKRFSLVVALLLLTATMVGCSTDSNEPEPQGPTPTPKKLSEQIEALDGVTRVKKLSTKLYDQKFEVTISQPLDGKNPAAGTFSQRVIVMHVGYDRPTILVTEGYDASSAMKPEFVEELSDLFDANVVVVEHRYYGESIPKPLDWAYLTCENSAYDLHRIRTLFNTIYPNKWASTGISKGGTTTMLYAAYFPGEVDAYLPYVAPLCKSLDDERVTEFFKTVSTAENRALVQGYQREMLRRKADVMPMFEDYCNKRNYVFRRPISEIYEYLVLEYAFSFWQWGLPIREIPTLTSPDGDMLSALYANVEPSYFAEEYAYAPSFVQDAREMGYYPYDLEPFRDYTTITSTKGYLHKLLLPSELQNIEFSTAFYDKVSGYLKDNDPRMIMIYGENDPWTAPGAGWTVTPDKRNMKCYIVAEGSHASRIASLPAAQRTEAVEMLRGWLEN